MCPPSLPSLFSHDLFEETAKTKALRVAKLTMANWTLSACNILELSSLPGFLVSLFCDLSCLSMSNWSHYLDAKPQVWIGPCLQCRRKLGESFVSIFHFSIVHCLEAKEGILQRGELECLTERSSEFECFLEYSIPVLFNMSQSRAETFK